jgi:Dyp-type peroxidase family
MSQSSNAEISSATEKFDLNNKSPIDENDLKVQALLERLQGNILKGHGREFSVHIFFSFGDDIPAVRRQLAELTRQYVTSALRQYQEARKFKASGTPGGLFGNLFLSASGYRRLGFDPAKLLPEERSIAKSSFATGMAAHAAEDFADPPQEQWDPGYQNEIDAMILLAGGDEGRLLRQSLQIANAIAAKNTIRAVELGKVLRNAKGEGIEHFGYVDGLSQPLYLKSDFDFDENGARIADRKGSKIDIWDPFEPLRRILVRDHGVDDPLCHGSFLVFRKLEQDVKRFKLRERELAEELGLQGSERERAGALAVGRFKNGTPVTLSKTDGFNPAKENNFNFDNDREGLKCPFHAHIRKANPRGDLQLYRGAAEAEERFRRITRRGITYGDRPNQPQSIDDLPSGGVGILFMCFQASIRRQFAFMQRTWLSSPRFVLRGTGLDPVAGQASSPPAVKQTWSKEYGGPPDTQFHFESYIRMKGGEFFFASSIPFLRGLPNDQ